MAIIKDFETPQGITATYHKLLKVEIRSALDSEPNQVICTVAVYASAEARSAGRDYLWLQYVSFPLSTFSTDPRSAFYSLLESNVSSYLAGGIGDTA